MLVVEAVVLIMEQTLRLALVVQVAEVMVDFKAHYQEMVLQDQQIQVVEGEGGLVMLAMVVLVDLAS
jgi:hypothetical protein